MESGTIRTEVCVVGAGPAGVMLALLLARAGIDVVLLEKHGDFFRDFRGDTVHPATLDVLDELGLADRFHDLAHRKVRTIGFTRNGVRTDIGDFRLLDLKYPYIAFVPQWDFLNLLSAEAARYDSFRLLMRTEATELITEGPRTAGIRARTPHGWLRVRAGLVVATDGRDSGLRSSAGLVRQDLGVPMDAMMFRISRSETDPDEGLSVRISNGRVFGVIDRGTYWQMSYETAAGGYERLLRDGVERLRRELADSVPFLADRTGEITGIDDVRLLRVRVDRLRRWYLPGLLFIGDAAHAMSPAGGSGVNMAVQDAVAAANVLVNPLLEGRRTGRPVDTDVLAAIQRTRWLPTVLAQRTQRVVLRMAMKELRDGSGSGVTGARVQQAVFRRVPLLRKAFAWWTGVGLRAQHVRAPQRADPRPLPSSERRG